MIEPREPSRFPIVPTGGAEGHVLPWSVLPSGQQNAVASGPVSENLLSIAWRNRWVILVCEVLLMVAGFVYVQVATPIFTSTSRLYCDYVDIRLLASETGRLPQTERYLHTQAGVIGSRPVLASAVQALESQRLQTFRDVDVPVAFVDKHLLVEVGRRDEIISISFESPYPVEAAQIVNSVVEAYMTSRSDRERRNAAQVLQILQGDLQRVDAELTKKQTELDSFETDGTRLSLGSEVGGGIMQRYLSLEVELASARIASMEARLFQDAVKVLSPDPGALRQYVRLKNNAGSYAGEAEASPLEAQLTQLSLEVKQLSETLTADHPTVASLMSRRAMIEARLHELDEGFVNAICTAAAQVCAQTADYESQLSRLCEEQKSQIAAVNAEIIRSQRLRAEVDRLDKNRQDLEQQVGEIARIVGEDVGQLRMAILEPALPAVIPSAPQKGTIMAMALVLGLLLGGGIAVARDWLDQSIRSADEISATLGVSALGVIPAMSRREKVAVRGQQVFRRPDSHEAEAFRTVRTAIFFGASKEGVKSLVITSPGAGDGKSTLVSNLGIAMALAGQKTVILDADLRKPTQHMVFEVDPRGRSLEDVLDGNVQLGQAIWPTQVKGLSVLVCHGRSANPAETLTSPRFNKLLQVLKENFDRVLIDAPPVNVVTDAQILAAASDGTIILLKADKTTRKMAQRAIVALRSVGARIMGAVVNQVSKNDDRYGCSYYGRYKHGYGSGSNGKKDKAAETAAASGERSEMAGTSRHASR